MTIIQENPTVLICHRNPILKSESFVLAQANNLRRFEPCYAGGQQSDSLPLPESRTGSVAGQDRYGAVTGKWSKPTEFIPDFEAELELISPALVHAHFEKSGLAALPLATELDIPLITTFYNCDIRYTQIHCGPRWLFERIYSHQRRKLQLEGSLFIAVSEFIREKLIECGYPEQRTTTLPIGVDVDLFTPQQEEPESPTVIFVGRMTERKGVTYLLQAMAEVAKVRKDVRLVVIGDGPLIDGLIDQAISLDLPNVIFTGSRDPEGVRYQMGRASMLVAPSVTDGSGECEGLPIVIAEAQAMGLPVVGTYCGAIPEIVRDGQNGFLVPERSIHQLAQSILLLLAQAGLRREMGLAARANVCLNFNLKLQTARLEDIYLKAVSDYSKARADL
jgi:glycosyltransferase involved in cell wall biosynthesis